ncbi:MAG: cation-translocating P-type ATPase [Polyangiaceae bacterium]
MKKRDHESTCEDVREAEPPTSAPATPAVLTLDGLTTVQAEQLLLELGPNALPAVEPTPLWRRFLRQFKSALIYVLLFALAFDVASWALAGATGLPIEALAIAAILLLNACLGTYQEKRSEQALAQLTALAAPLSWVLRDGELVRLPSQCLVPGDIVRIEAGERIPADGLLVQALGLMVDESLLTGESVPVDKTGAQETFSGTLVVRGKGRFRVTRTGSKSSMGKLARLLGEIKVEPTPLEKRLSVLGKQIARVVFALSVTLAVAGIAVEGFGRFEEIILFAVALAVAAVPEGMPAVVTLTLALGVSRMARRKAVVRRLAAVEALGSVTVIATDKTGTLTENRMTVRELASDDVEEARCAMVLANDADSAGGAGDPLELGLLEHARAAGVDIVALRSARPRVESRPFDSAWKFMRVTVEVDGNRRSYLKGAPEVIIERSTLTSAERARWTARAEAAAAQGERVLALATSPDVSEDGLAFLGLVLLRDPPRTEVPDAIAQAKRAGIRVLMITGDHPHTAEAVAREVGIVSGSTLIGDDIERMSVQELRHAVRTVGVFARVSPEHKLRLVEALKANGDVVAMTGDGVNDAPALKRADVGIAMGQRGSDVAREVADIVLLDDNFASIVGAIEEGRSIYENIQSFIRFTSSTNLALVLLIAAGAVGSYVMKLRDPSGMLLLPLTAVQLLWINFLGDGPPALALALDRSPGLMHRPPRPAKSALLDPASVRFIVAAGVFNGLLGLALLVALPRFGYSFLVIQTVIFLYQSVAKLTSAYPSRKLFQRPHGNLILHVSIALGIGLQILTLVVPSLRGVLKLAPLSGRELGVLVAAIAASWCVAEAASRTLRRSMSPGPELALENEG